MSHILSDNVTESITLFLFTGKEIVFVKISQFFFWWKRVWVKKIFFKRLIFLETDSIVFNGNQICLV